MLARIRRLDRPFHMLRSRQRNVNAIDIRRGKQLLIRTERMQRAEMAGQMLGLGQITAGNAGKDAVVGFDDPRDHMLPPDFGRRQNTPAKHGKSPCVNDRPAHADRLD